MTRVCGNSPPSSSSGAAPAEQSRTGGSRFRATSGSASSPSWRSWATRSSVLGAERGSLMLPLYEEPHFTFRFSDDRLIPRFHLESVEAGQRVSVFKIDPGTGERLGLLAMATVGEGGWVELAAPILVRAGEGFIAVPEKEDRLP